MVMYLLTLVGALCIVLMVRSIWVDSLIQGVVLFVLALFSLIITAVLTNVVSP